MPVAVVSGGNRGIGREVCRQLVERGYEVIIGSRDFDNGANAVAELGAPPGLRAEQLDATDDESCAALAEHLDRLDVLVNNAAIGYDTWEEASDADLVGARRIFDTPPQGSSVAEEAAGWAVVREGCRPDHGGRSISDRAPACAAHVGGDPAGTDGVDVAVER
jgi:NAD(P)-dependent dehydrogenase (short-subunit alcohol dehydrogenase family)